VSWLAPAIVAILSGSVILSAVFLYLYAREREPWMGIWGVAWLAYSARFGVELYQVLSHSTAVGPALVNYLLVLVTGVLLLDGSYALAGKTIPKWHRGLALAVAAWTIVAATLALPEFYLGIAAWTFRGVANIAAGVVWYRSITQSGPWGKITGVAFITWGLHNLDYPFLRGVASFAPFGFMFGAFLEFIIAFGALIAYFELTRERLSESESRYRSMFEDSASVMLIVDPGTQRVVQANGAAAAYYGWSQEQLATMHMSQINTLSPQEAAAEMARAAAGERASFSFCHRLSSGELRDVEVFTGPIVAQGRHLLYSIIHDVTDRARAERELRESEERYSTLFESSLSPMLLVAAEDAKILDANAAAAKMYGWPIASLIGMTVGELSVDSDDIVAREVTETIADGGRARTFTHCRADGTQFEVEIYSTPMHFGDNLMLYTIVNDISLRAEAQRQVAEYQQHLEDLVKERTGELSKANEELERASVAKDAYLANLSHELRTPLNSVIGFSSLLAGGMVGDLTDEQRRQIEMINDSGRHLLRVVDGILDLARIAAGAVEANIEEVDISHLCGEVADRIAPALEHKRVALSRVIEPNVCIHTDPLLLEQILWNLLGNAEKFTNAGTVEISLSTDEQAVRIVVSDTGRGIRAEDAWRVFEMFVRVEDENGARSDGTGLGLPISRRLVEVLGGRIEFESEYGKGSTFTVVLPRE
jgi:PAS domain S-box-containing protein